MRQKLNQVGITITELVIVITMAGFIAILLGGITITFYGAVLRSEVEARMVVDSQIILRDMVDELRVSSSVLQTNSITDANGPGGGWNTSSANAILIIETPVLAADGSFVIDDDTGDPFTNELVYFAEDDTMFRRTLVNTTAPENDRVLTCPEADVGTGGCERADAELSNDYTNMAFVFYDQDDILTSDTTLARSIDMTINLQRRVFGQTVAIDNNIRTTLRN